MRAGSPGEASRSGRDGVAGFFSDRELAVVICFCAIGLAASIVLALSFPLPDETASVLSYLL
jgi:hypothetical protein